MAEVREGGCLCGSVRYRVRGEPKTTGVCHCSVCKRRTGSAFGMSAYFDEANVRVTSGVLKTHRFHSAESGRWGTMEFCPICGTTITWTGEVLPGMRATAAGTLDDPNWIKPKVHAWTRPALRWVIFPSDVELETTQTQIGIYPGGRHPVGTESRHPSNATVSGSES